MDDASPAREPLALDFSFVAETTLPEPVDHARLEDLAAFVLRDEGAGGAWEITVALVDDARLQALHHQFMGIDSPTDIMTFPLVEGTGTPRGGDLVISVDHARARAAEFGFSPVEEIRFLTVHGLLHLLGWRDETAEQRRRMLARQQALIDAWSQGGKQPGEPTRL